MDVDAIVEVHGHAKQGVGFGYTGARRPTMLLATASPAADGAPVIAA